MIAHRPATIALADRVVLIDGGRVVAEGTHDDLLATEARYRRVLAAAARDESARRRGRRRSAGDGAGDAVGGRPRRRRRRVDDGATGPGRPDAGRGGGR